MASPGNEHFIMSTVTIMLLGLTFWVIKKLVDRVDGKVDKLSTDQKRRWHEHDETRAKFVKGFLTEPVHQLVCEKTQAEVKLHISEVAEENRKLMLQAIVDNRDTVMEAFKELKSELKKNGYKK